MESSVGCRVSLTSDLCLLTSGLRAKPALVTYSRASVIKNKKNDAEIWMESRVGCRVSRVGCRAMGCRGRAALGHKEP